MVKKSKPAKPKKPVEKETKVVVPEIVESSETGKISKNKSTARELSDFEKYALVATHFPQQQDPFCMDGTSIVEISKMANDKYATQLTRNVKRIFKFDKLDELYKNDLVDVYLSSGKHQIDEIWKRMQSLETHTSMFNIAFLLCIGKILNHIEASFVKKSPYMNWLKDNFGHERMRYFQQAKQLDRMGDFARIYAPLGKTRLLEIDRLDKKLLPRSYYFPEEGIFELHPFEDTTLDIDSLLLKEHVDAIITYYRFMDEEVDFIQFDQAELIASCLHRSIPKKRVTRIKKWLENQENEEEAFDDLVMNKMIFPYSESGESMSGPSLNKLFAEIISYVQKVDVNDEEWIANQKGEIEAEIMFNAYNIILNLADKLGIDLDGSIAASNQNEGEVA